MHIQKALPDINDKVRREIQCREEHLKCLGEECLDPRKAMTRFIHDFCKFYENRTKSGRGIKIQPNSVDISTGSEISDIFYNDYKVKINNIRPLEGFTREQKEKILNSIIGLEPHSCEPAEYFNGFMKQAVAKLLEPSKECADCVYDKLVAAIDASDEQVSSENLLFLNSKFHI